MLKSYYPSLFALWFLIWSCAPSNDQKQTANETTDDWQPDTTVVVKAEADENGFVWQTEQFADLKIIRYQIPGWDNLSLQQKQLVYYLVEAGLAGREMIQDQNYRHNLAIRRALENVYEKFQGDRETRGWKRFETYLKRIWFSNGIHHHYANTKFTPEFSEAYFDELLANTGITVSDELRKVIFDPSIDSKKVEQDPAKGLVEGSAVNFYAPDITTEEAQNYLESIAEKDTRTPVSVSINSKLVKNEAGEIEERTYRVGGMYSEALTEVVKWLKKAEAVAENDKQAAALRHLIKYYETGDLKTWDTYNIAWVNATDGDIDYINGFVEVYNDPLGYTGSYENIVQIKDFTASSRMQVLMENAQWFEDHMPFMDQHKKENVVGITYNVVNVAGEAGDASPSTPIGVNLPNANWIRATHGSKSVSLGNILEAYDNASGPGMIEEFAQDQEEIDRVNKYGSLAGKLHTALHEVVGHASGKIEDGVGTPKETIKNYASTIEEGRADLIALYFMMDPKLVELGLVESLEVGMAEYDNYIRNGLMTQLRRLELGADIEEAHMRNRAWVSHWVFEKGAEENVIAEIKRNGKTYYDISDYERLRELFGELLHEVQRITSQGDYEAAKNLVETYGVKVNQDLHNEVLERTAALGAAPYGGFINPRLVPVTAEDGSIEDIKVEYPDNFAGQMMDYSKRYSFLPDYN
jgi:dipeptidyl-peptidase-3